MTTIKRSTIHRALALFVIILLAFTMLFSLTSCGASGISRGKNASGEPDSLAKFAADILKQDANNVVKFVAASRGYDIDSPTFEDSEVPEVPKDANLALATKILKDAIASTKFADNEDHIAIDDYANNDDNGLSSSDVDEIIGHIGTEYDLGQSAGFFDYPLFWIGAALGWITSLLGGSYVSAILIFAVLVEILMLPVAIKQQKNSIGMAKLRPMMAKIEKKYAGRTDQLTLRKKQEEMMALQQKEGFSPFSGCLPMLVQLIIVGFILYPIIQNPLRFVLDTSTGFSNALVTYATTPKAAGGLGITMTSNGNVIELLSVLKGINMEGIQEFALIHNSEDVYIKFSEIAGRIPDFTLFGLQIGRVPQIIDILVIVPILNVAGQWVSMKLMRKWSMTGAPTAAQDAQSQASMKIMDLVLPLMTLFIMFQVPALIGIYWFFRSMLSLLKSYVMKKIMPIPKYTDEEIRDMEKAQKAAEKAQKEALREQPKFRSLHYIDEDDYDELPTLKADTSENKQNKKSGIDIPDIKD